MQLKDRAQFESSKKKGGGCSCAKGTFFSNRIPLPPHSQQAKRNGQKRDILRQFSISAFGTNGQFLRQSFRRQTTTGRNNRLWEEEEIRFQSIIVVLKISRKSCVSVLPNPFLEELWGSESNSLEFDTLRRRVRLEKERSLEGIDREPGGMEEII